MRTWERIAATVIAVAAAAAGLVANDAAAPQAAAPAETCGVVVKVTIGCEPELDVKALAQSFKIQIPASARQKFPALMSTYQDATVCVTAASSKPDKSFKVKATDQTMVRIASPKPEPPLGEVYDVKTPGLTPPTLRFQREPKYTPQASQAEIQGDGELSAVVLTDGTLGRLRVVKPLDPCGGLDEEAVKAATRWRFSPAQLEGRPVAARITLIMSFRLHS
jgi:TonB family protein